MIKRVITKDNDMVRPYSYDETRGCFLVRLCVQLDLIAQRPVRVAVPSGQPSSGCFTLTDEFCNHLT